ncbi:MAG: VWA-like domain-containing protein [Coriobacteriales bacterium]
MRDMTPVAQDDVMLQRREALRERGFKPERPSEGERLKISTLEEEERRQRRFEAARPIAVDILEEARNALAVRFRFLDQVLWRMPLVPSEQIFGLACDGRSLVFDPVYIVERFKLGPNEVVRDVAHSLFHCIFRHPFGLYNVLRQPWDVACDIAVEVMLMELLGEAFPSNMDRRAKDSLRVLSAQCGGVLTAERLYRFFADKGNHTDFSSLGRLFHHDGHGLWYGEDDEGAAPGASRARRQAQGDDGSPQERSLPTQGGTEQLDGISTGPVEVPLPDEGEPESAMESADAQGDAQAGGQGAGSGEAAGREQDPAVDEEELAAQWEELSKRIQVELETRLTQQGKGAGNLVAQLKAVNREKHDYASFLKRFATLHECMRVNDDEFDYIYYTFGLKRYGNMPLIEPLEYKEDRQVCDFCIAIDTSESCSGELVQAFMRKTYNILRQAGSFGSRVNVHVIQCDAAVQRDDKIESLEQLDLFLEDMELVGFGGTDFRPLFSYVDTLVEKGEFSDLRGIVYFTDGEGTFPRKPPAYDAVFAFLDDGYSDPEVPPWALKVLLSEDELEVKDAGPARRRS